MSDVTKVRAKFRCIKVSKTSYNSTQIIYEFQAMSNDGTPENERYHRFTPQGALSLTVDNPAIDGFYVLGQDYYLDFTPVGAA